MGLALAGLAAHSLDVRQIAPPKSGLISEEEAAKGLHLTRAVLRRAGLKP